MRIPNKNERPIAGRPLVLWAIEGAKRSRRLTSVLVSTDSAFIADISRAAGADVPFLRPDHLASNTASMADVIRHAVDSVESRGMAVSAAVTLQPTSPLRSPDDIDAAIELYLQHPDTSLVSVTPVSPPPDFWLRMEGDTLVPVAGKWPSTRSQDAPRAYALNGAIFVTPRSVLHAGSLVSPRPRAYVMPRDRSVDIDDETDWRIAEALLR